jgi:hypothetical protein
MCWLKDVSDHGRRSLAANASGVASQAAGLAIDPTPRTCEADGPNRRVPHGGVPSRARPSLRAEAREGLYAWTNFDPRSRKVAFREELLDAIATVSGTPPGCDRTIASTSITCSAMRSG